MSAPVCDLPTVYEDADDTGEPERRLMVAVIVNAIMDAIGRGGAGRQLRHKHEALRWFREYGQDFQAVCLFAGFDPLRVRRAALAYIDAEVESGRRHRQDHATIAQFQYERLAA